jgi:galactokinase
VTAPEPRGIFLMVDGRVPAGAGVSSSSALTVSSLLAVARANGIDAHMTRAGA